MAERIETPELRDILYDEFMKPMGISAYKLAKNINVPVSRIQDLLHGRRKMTADTSLRLARYFGVSDLYFLNIQNDLDIRRARMEIEKDLADIVPVSKLSL